jgi:putative peptidoglycan lipid II flippase
MLLYLLRKKIGPFGGRGITLAGGKALIASLPMACGVYWGIRFVDWSVAGHKLLKGAFLGGVVLGAIAIFLVTAYLLHIEEAHAANELFRRRVLKR